MIEPLCVLSAVFYIVAAVFNILGTRSLTRARKEHEMAKEVYAESVRTFEVMLEQARAGERNAKSNALVKIGFALMSEGWTEAQVEGFFRRNHIKA